MADLVVMDDGDHGDASAFLLIDQFDHDRAIGRVERSGRLVQRGLIYLTNADRLVRSTAIPRKAVAAA